MEFTPINTQEEFDARVTELYGDVRDLQGQVTTLTGERDAHAATIADLQNQIKGHEESALKHRIAHEKGIPFEMASRLSGKTEDDIRNDADVVAKFMKKSEPPTPRKSTETGTADSKKVAFKKMLNEMKGE